MSCPLAWTSEWQSHRAGDWRLRGFVADGFVADWRLRGFVADWRLHGFVAEAGYADFLAETGCADYLAVQTFGRRRLCGFLEPRPAPQYFGRWTALRTI